MKCQRCGKPLDVLDSDSPFLTKMSMCGDCYYTAIGDVVEETNMLSLNERVEIACEEGLWRTYSDIYSHKDLDGFKVPRRVDQLDKNQLKTLRKLRESF